MHFRLSRQQLLTYIFAVAGLSASCASGAEIETLRIDGVVMLLVSGELLEGDAALFAKGLTEAQPDAVILSSPGGRLIESLAIGRHIRKKQMATVVPPDVVCASSCALIWLAGKTRFMASNSLIGFHAAYVTTEAGDAESGVGNALVGSYLNQLGLSDEAVIFATSTAPSDLQFLNYEMALRLDIDVTLLDDQSVAAEQPSLTIDVPLRLPTGFRWIVLASAGTEQQLQKSRYTSMFSTTQLLTVKTQSGYNALVAGPFMQTDAEELLAHLVASGEIPSDAYLSSGNGFVSQIEAEDQ